MKKQILLAAMCCLLGTTTVSAFYDPVYFEVGDFIYMIDTMPNTTNEVEVASWYHRNHDNEMISINIPSSVTYNGIKYSVTGIGYEAFYSRCDSIVAIILPNTITHIGTYAFERLRGLTFINIPNSVTSIGWGAFSGCRGLTSINIPNSVISIGGSAFRWCSNLKSITLPSGITEIEHSTFDGCGSLTTVVIPNNVKSIEYEAFYNCTSLQDITIPNSVTSIGDRAFGNCTSLQDITIPNSVTSIGKNAFLNVHNIIYYGTATGAPWGAKYMNAYEVGDFIYSSSNRDTLLACSTSATGNITIPNTVTTIEDNAFLGCSNITSVTIPSTVINIGDSAFLECPNLTKVELHSNDIVSKNHTTSSLINIFGSQVQEFVIGDEITSIGDYAFSNFNNLKTINIPDSVTSIGGNAFGGCVGLTSISIPKAMTTIKDNAFNGCSNITSVTIPSTVINIGDSAFLECPNLTKVELHSNDIVSKNHTTSSLINIFGSQVQEFVIGDEITSIGDYAFSNFNNLKTINIPDSVTSIGGNAFGGCVGLTSISIPKAMTLIGKDAFLNCTGLTKVNITDIARWCNIDFASATSNPLYYAEHLYLNNTEITDLVIPEGVTSIKQYAFYNANSITSVTIPTSVTNMSNAFYCKKVNRMNITDLVWFCNLTSRPFSSNSLRLYLNDEEITDLVIPDGITTIKDYQFYNCCGIKSVTFSNTVLDIGARAFYNCPIESVTFSNSVLSIGSSAFENCPIESVTLPNSVLNIGSYAFYNCLIKYVTLPNSVLSIEPYTFYDCPIENIVFGSSVKTIERGAFYNSKGNTIQTITCYSMRPPTVKLSSYDYPIPSFREDMPYSTIIYVPADYMTYYQVHDFWGLYDVRPLGAATVQTEELKVEPTNTTADVVWPVVTGAATYELLIRDSQGTVVCTLIFNAAGQLTQIAFQSPALREMTEATAGFSFTVTGLKEGTKYDLTITAKDATGAVVDTFEQTFFTAGVTTDTNQVETTVSSTRKILENGQVLILTPDGKRYNLQGGEVQ